MKAQEKKQLLVQEIKENIKNASSVIFVDFSGINVAQDTVLRREFSEKNVVYKVYKNRLLVRALNELGITDYDAQMFEGTTSVAFGQDETSAVKTIYNTISSIKKLKVKFGYVNGSLVSANELEALSKIPAKETLIAMLLGVMQAPISALARALNEVAKKQQ